MRLNGTLPGDPAGEAFPLGAALECRLLVPYGDLEKFPAFKTGRKNAMWEVGRMVI